MFASSSRHGRGGAGSSFVGRWYSRVSAIRPRTWLVLLSSVFAFLVVMNLLYLYFPDTTTSLQSYLPLRSAAAATASRSSDAAAAPPNKPPVAPRAINAAPPVPTQAQAASPLGLGAAAQPPQQLPLTLNATSRDAWRQPHGPSAAYCDRQFGNGFSVQQQLCSASAASTSHLTCHHNPLTVSTVCEAANLRIHTPLITVSRGDEDIASVRHRAEQAEFPTYQQGALSLDCLPPNPPPALGGGMFRDHLASMFGSVRYGPVAGGEECGEEVEEAVVLTRYEYANLYHTMTDLYNTYQALQMFARSPHPPLVLFMDGHSKGAMDPLWPTLFSPHVRYVMHGAPTLCIKHAIFVSPGYGSALTPHMFTGESARCAAHPLVLDFAAFVQRKYRLGAEDSSEAVVVSDVAGQEVELKAARDDANPLVSFIVRRSYLSHPRVKLDATERTMRDELPTLRAIQDTLASKYAIRFHAFDFTTLPLHTQLNVLYHSSLLAGLHGAALSYILLLPQHVSLLELMPGAYQARQHFRYFSVWSGHAYRAMGVVEGGDSGGYGVDRDEMVSAIVDMVGGGAVKAKIEGGGGGGGDAADMAGGEGDGGTVPGEDSAEEDVGQKKQRSTIAFSKIKKQRPQAGAGPGRGGQQRGQT